MKNPETIIRAEFKKRMRDDIGDEIDDIPISNLGIDSLDFFEMLLYLEDEFNINLPIEELDDTVTLRSIIKIL